MNTVNRSRTAVLILAFAGALGAALLPGGGLGPQNLALSANVQAAEDGHSSGDRTSGGHSSLPRGHSGSHDSGDDGLDNEEDGQGGAKHGGHDSRGDHDTVHGGRALEDRVFGDDRPVWAREGIPAVELGRLNVGRAPGHVLARAEAEALSEYTVAMAELYNLSAEQAAALLQTGYDSVARIDSPLQNLALYKDVMTFGRSQLPGLDNDRLELAAIFLGSAADKNVPISEDTVTAINRILGLVEPSPAERAELAIKADAVRAAIYSGHGP